MLNTPDLHRIHHSIDTQHLNANHALIFPLWDLLFGTSRVPERESEDVLGLEGIRRPDRGPARRSRGSSSWDTS